MQAELQTFVGNVFASDGSNDFSAVESQFTECTFDRFFAARSRSGFQVVSSVFANCKFLDLDVDCFSFGSGRDVSRYLDCEFLNCKIRSPTVGRARFERCVFRRCTIRELFSFRADFIDCVFDEVEFSRTVFSAKEVSRLPSFLLRRICFEGNDFRTSTFRDVSFRGGINLSKQRFDPSNMILFDILKSVRFLREVASRTKDEKVKKRFEAIAFAFQIDLDSGQKTGVVDVRSNLMRDPRVLSALREVGCAS